MPAGLVPLAGWYEHEFYEHYPRKKEPQDGWKAVLKLRPDADLRATILARMVVFKERDRVWRDGYAPYPASWINARGWEGEPDPPPTPKPGRNRDGPRDGLCDGAKGPPPTGPPRPSQPSLEDAAERIRRLVATGASGETTGGTSAGAITERPFAS